MKASQISQIYLSLSNRSGGTAVMKRMVLAIILCCILLISVANSEPVLSFGLQGNYRVFEKNSLFGLQDIDGNTIIGARYAGMEPIVNGFVVVSDQSGFGVYSIGGNEVLPTDYDYICIDEQAWLLRKNDKTFMYDPESCIRISDEYDSIWHIRNSGFYGCFSQYSETYGVLNADGELVLPCVYMDLQESNDSTIVMLSGENYRVRYYSLSSLSFLDGDYHWGSAFCDGYAAVCSEPDQGCWIINEQGERVTSVYEDIAASNGQGCFACMENGGWYIRDIQQEEAFIAGPYKEEPYYIGNGFFTIQEANSFIVYSCLDQQERVYDGIDAIANFEGVAAATIQGAWSKHPKYGLFYPNMDIEPAVFDDVLILDNSIFVLNDDVWHIQYSQYEFDKSQTYTDVSVDYTYNCFVIQQDGLSIYLNEQLKPVSATSIYCE